MNQRSAWELFLSNFLLGQDVVVITDEDEFFAGKLVLVAEDYCIIRGPNEEYKLEWLNIRFMAHDGFPVRQLKGADGSKSIEKIDTTETQELIRDSLQKESYKMRAVIGDPFEIDVVESRLWNPGMSGPRCWGHKFEETLVLTAPDGAVGLLYDIPTIYVAEMAK